MTKVLVVDDEEKLKLNVKIFLEMNGFEVVTASDGAEGIAKIESEKPQVVVTDVMMPGMDGYTMLKEIRGKYSPQALPIIMLTAKESISDLYELEGANEFIPKPFELNTLVATINKYVSQQ